VSSRWEVRTVAEQTAAGGPSRGADEPSPGASESPATADRIGRLTGALAVLGGFCLLLASVPGRLYRGPPPDSYVFDPPPFTGLWVQRVVIPGLAVVAVLGVVAAVVGLLHRDRPDAGRLHGVAGGLTAFGAGMLLVAVLLLAGTGSLSGGSPDVVGALIVTVGALGGLLAGLVVIVAATIWGIGYLRRGRRRLGVTLVAAPLGTLLLVVLATVVELPTGGGLLVVLPTVAGVVVTGVDLWQGAVENVSGAVRTEQREDESTGDDQGDGESTSDDRRDGESTDDGQGA
jgi:hypothetical protein